MSRKLMSHTHTKSALALREVIKAMLVLVLLGLTVFRVDAQPSLLVEVITNDAYPVKGINRLKNQGLSVHLYNLDDGKRLVSEWTRTLPKTGGERAAKQHMKAYFQNIGRENTMAMVNRRFKGYMIAAQYGVSRYPAIVFDGGKAVVYGVTDASDALSRYLEWKQRNLHD